MDFSLSEEQLLLKDSITTFVDKDYLFDVRQKNIKTELGYSSDFWKTFADLGWLGMPFSEAAALAHANETPKIALAPSLDLFSVPSI